MSILAKQIQASCGSPLRSDFAASSALRIELMLDAVDENFVQDMGMREVALDTGLAYREACWRGERVRLETRAFVGAGRLSRLLVARGTSLDAAYERLLLLALPRPTLGAASFVLDLLASRDHWEMLGLDLPQTVTRMGGIRGAHPELYATQRELQQLGEPLPTCRPLEPFASDAEVLLCDLELQELAVDRAVFRYMDAFAARLEGARAVDPELTRKRQRAFLRAQQENTQFAGELGEVFGSAWSERYRRELLLDLRVV